MGPDDDLSRIAEQERLLRFDRFDEEVAWRLGGLMRSRAAEAALPIVIDVRFFHRELFFAALPGSAPDNVDWVRRKTNVVRRFHRSSYAMGLKLAAGNSSLEAKYGLPLSDYAAHGGAFPICVNEVGVIGCVTASGLPQRDDHAFVVRALSDTLGIVVAELP